jgi:NADPH-dependent curcumin reductase CurA
LNTVTGIPAQQSQVILAKRPEGALAPDHFLEEVGPVPDPAPGELLIRTILLSIDPANRAWMVGPTYRSQIAEGEVMSGFSLGEVVRAPGGELELGTIVLSDSGWREYACVKASSARPVAVRGALSHHLGALGITGLTGYLGLVEIGRPVAGETVLVSAAAGATGTVVGQVAKILGCRVVGIAGSEEKCRFLEDELGFDATVSHRSLELRAELKEACPSGVDVYFDNVGGQLLGQALTRMNVHGRIVCCGVVSQYDRSEPEPGPRAVPGLVVVKRLRMEGFLLDDLVDRWPAAEARLAGWLNDGRLRAVEDIVDGLDQAPNALIGLLAGDNLGKRLVRVAPDPSREARADTAPKARGVG